MPETDKQTKAPPGFTLLEIMVAVFIFAVVMTTLFSSFGSFITTGQALTASVLVQESLQIPMGVIEADFTNLVVDQPPRYKTPRFSAEPDPFRMAGEEANIGGKTFSTLLFASLNHIPSGGVQAVGIARIQYHVRANADQGWDLCRSDSLRPFPDNPSTDCDPVLFRNVMEFFVVFYDTEGKESARWDTQNSETDFRFPTSVGITITVKTGSGQQTITTRFPLAVDRTVEN
ncbi:MAG: prepilin-type N-terminal cleavage/methylation domain-containing protein [Pseudomonadota bacterium]